MWLRKKKSRVSAVDVVWFTKAEKLKAIVDAVRKAVASDRKVLLLAHFRATRSEISTGLKAEGIEHRIFDHPLDSGSFMSWSKGRDQHQIILSLSERISPYAANVAPAELTESPDIIVVERYPLEDRDDIILSFAAACGLRGDVYFHSSLEDPMFRHFGSDRYTKVFRALGNTSTEPLTGAAITRAIRSAQRKVKKISLGDQRVPSPEDWFTYNLRR